MGMGWSATKPKRVVIEVVGQPSFLANPGATLLDLCDVHGVAIDAACGGFAACSACRVRVLAGGQHLSPISEEEEAFLDEAGQRLACQCVVTADVRVTLDPGA